MCSIWLKYISFANIYSNELQDRRCNSAQEGQNITHAGLAIRSSEDIIDAAHYGGGVRQVPAVIQGSWEIKSRVLKKKILTRYFTLYFGSTVNELLNAAAKLGLGCDRIFIAFMM